MRALAIDVGTGTQDILVFDSEREIENSFRLVLPSPTVLVADAIRAATAIGAPVVLRGAIMGGGPSHWAARDHAAAGLPIAAIEEAARTFDDDPDGVRAMGIRVVGISEAQDLARTPGTVEVHTGDVQLEAIAGALAPFGVDLHTVEACVVAVFDHGAAPVGVSDRRFRFARLAEVLRAQPDAGPAAFAYPGEAVPPAFTRLGSAARVARAWFGGTDGWTGGPVIVVMDTGPAAVLGSLEDEAVAAALQHGRPVVAVNVGNFHALAMRIATGPDGPRIDGIVEHHTGELTPGALAQLVAQVADGTVDGEAVFRTMGHGALMRDGWRPDGERPFLAVTGPRRAMLRGVEVDRLGVPWAAVPHGDMMQTGNFGALRALALRVPAWQAAIAARLGHVPGNPGSPRPHERSRSRQ